MSGAFPAFIISSNRLRLAGLLLIAGIGCIAYWPSLRGQYIRDDFDLIRNNAYVRSWANISKFFTQDIAAGSGRYHGFYRPLQMISYCIDYAFWENNVFGYHLTNTLLHICAALLLVRLLLHMQVPPFVHNFFSNLCSSVRS